MIANILIAAGFTAVGFLLGVYCTSLMILKKFKKYPKDVILILEEHAEQL